MKNRLQNLVYPALIALAVGCSSEEPEAPIVGTTPVQPQSEAVSIGQPSAEAPPPGGVVAPPQSTAIDISQTERPKNAQGDAMSDLEFLNHMVAEVNESRIAPTEIPQKAFKTEAEQLAYEEAQQQKRQGPVRDLNELVTAGILKALPQAPSGQKYAIDPATGKVVLQ